MQSEDPLIQVPRFHKDQVDNLGRLIGWSEERKRW